MMTSDQIEPLFTQPDGSYRFARWARPIAPVVFGVRDDTLPPIKGALEAMVTLSGHHMAQTDPELGANLMLFFFRDWDELPNVPDLDRLVPDLGTRVTQLKESGANQFRMFRFERDGAIRAAFVFLRMDKALGTLATEDLALGQVVQIMLVWAAQAFAETSPLAHVGGRTILKPEIGALIRAAYDPVMPAAASDKSHALRLAARIGQG